MLHMYLTQKLPLIRAGDQTSQTPELLLDCMNHCAFYAPWLKEQTGKPQRRKKIYILKKNAIFISLEDGREKGGVGGKKGQERSEKIISPVCFHVFKPVCDLFITVAHRLISYQHYSGVFCQLQQEQVNLKSNLWSKTAVPQARVSNYLALVLSTLILV